MEVLLRTQSDARLVALARAGHDRAFEAIVERYRRPLLRACRRILPEARAEDALQHALMAAWTALRRGDEVQDLRPWLYRIVRNTALNQLRVAGYDLDELVDTLAAADDPEQEVERRALVRQTLLAVAALPERQRDALLRTAIEGRGQDEVARDLGLTNTALRQLVHRARTSVRAAATAVVPLPAAAWLASAASRAEPMAGRVAELVAGSSAAGATLAKAGTVVVLAGGAASTPALVERPPAARERPVPRAQAAQAAVVPAPAQERPAPSPAAGPAVNDEAAGRQVRAERDPDDARHEEVEHGRNEHARRDRDRERRDRSDDERDRDEHGGDRRDDDGDEHGGDERDDDSSGDGDRDSSHERRAAGARDDDEHSDDHEHSDDEERGDDDSSGEGSFEGEENLHDDH
jgi:RNA polymerase sigma factor (sigma-70 family)